MFQNGTDQNSKMKNEEVLQDKKQLQEMELSYKVAPQQCQPAKKQQRRDDINYQCIQACKKGQIKENYPLIIEFLLQNKYLNELEPANGNLLYYISKLVDYLEFETLSGVEELASMTYSKQFFVMSGQAIIITPRKGKKLTSKTIWKIKKRKEKEEEGNEENKVNANTSTSETKRKYKESIVRNQDSFGGTNLQKGAVIITMSALCVLSCKTEQFQKCFDLLLTRTAFISHCFARTLSFVGLDEIEKEISSEFKELSFEANQLIFSKGEPLSCFYLLRQGCCQVFESDPVNSSQTDSLSSSLIMPSSTTSPSSSSKSFFVKIGEIFGHEDQARVTNNSSTPTRTFSCRCLTSNTIVYAFDKTLFLNSKNSKISTQILNHASSKLRLLFVQKKPSTIPKTQERKNLQSLLLPSPISAKPKTTLKPLLPYEQPPKQFFLQQQPKQFSDNIRYPRTPTTPNQPLQTSKQLRSIDFFKSGISRQIPAILQKKLFNEEEPKKNPNKRGGSQDSDRLSPNHPSSNSPPSHILQETSDQPNSQTTLSSISIKISNSKEPIFVSESNQNEQKHLDTFLSEKTIKISPFPYMNQQDSQPNHSSKPLTPLSAVVLPAEKHNLNPNLTNISSQPSIFPLNSPDTIIEEQKTPQPPSQNDSQNTLFIFKKPSLKRGGSQISIQSSLSPNIFQSSRSSMRDNTIDRTAGSDKSKLQSLVIQDKRVRFKEQEDNHVMIVDKHPKNEDNIQKAQKFTGLLLPELTPVRSVFRKKEDNSPVKRFDYKSNNYRVFKQLSEVTEQRTFPMKKISTSQRNIILSTMNKKF